MAKNLNYGARINSTINASDNGSVEKYCYDNSESNCTTYGGLYPWNELMNYTTTESTQGICPDGWHIPSDQEWKELEMTLGMSQAQADLLYAWRGAPAGTSLKTGGSSGFHGMLAGFKNSAPAFVDLNADGYFWSSSNYNTLDSYMRIIGVGQSGVGRWTYQKTDGLSVRCVKDSEGELFSVIALDLKNSKDGSSCSWGDYDRDGDLDILYGKSRYKNISGSFSHAGGYAAGITESAFCNYNNDNYLDYVAIESYFPCGTTSLFKNNGSSFDSIYFELQCSYYTKMAWGDYDNNGTKDFIVQRLNNPPLGKDMPSIYLFKNVDKNGSFVKADESIPEMYNGSVDWGDYDKDLDLDLLITGTDINSNKETYVFRNDNNNFTKMNLSLAQISDGQAVWADYDSDGDLDIAMSGLNINPVTKIYRNDGNDLFTDIQAGFENMSGKVAVADIDNDGLNDIIVCGSGEDATKEVVIYKNEGNDTFSSYAKVSPINAIADARPGDYDNDGDLDILVGKTLLNNNLSLSNNPPSVPAGLKTIIRANEVIFSWEKSSDDKTSLAGLTYNLKVGTTSGGVDVVCPNTNGSTKKLNIPGVGNTFQNTSWKIKDLVPGTYYWSVQAIDNSFATSSFSSEATFEITGELY